MASNLASAHTVVTAWGPVGFLLGCLFLQLADTYLKKYMDVGEMAAELATPTKNDTAASDDEEEEGVMTRSGLRRRKSTKTPKKAATSHADSQASRRRILGCPCPRGHAECPDDGFLRAQ